jgi:hypothetical protein
MIKQHSLKLILENSKVIDEHFNSVERQLLEEGLWNWIKSKFYQMTDNVEGKALTDYTKKIDVLFQKYPEFFKEAEDPISDEQMDDFEAEAKRLYKTLADENKLTGEDRNKLISNLRKNFVKAITSQQHIDGKRIPRSTNVGKEALQQLAAAGGAPVDAEIKRKATLEELLQTFMDVDPGLHAVVLDPSSAPQSEKDKNEFVSATSAVANSPNPSAEARTQAARLAVLPAYQSIGVQGIQQMLISGVPVVGGVAAISSLQDVDIAAEDMNVVAALQQVYVKQRMSPTVARIRSKNLLKRIALKRDELEDSGRELDLVTLQKEIEAFNTEYADTVKPTAAKQLVDVLSPHFSIGSETEAETKLSQQEVEEMKQKIISDLRTISVDIDKTILLKLLKKLNDSGKLNKSWNKEAVDSTLLLGISAANSKEDISNLIKIPASVAAVVDTNSLGKAAAVAVTRQMIKEVLCHLVLRGALKDIVPVKINEHITFISRRAVTKM